MSNRCVGSLGSPVNTVTMLKAVVVGFFLSTAVGGTAGDPPKSFESVFLILRNNVATCIATLVSLGKDAILLAPAHCVYGFSNSKLGVQLTKQATPEPVKRVLVHPYYTPPSFEYDIALIRVNAPAAKKNGSDQLKCLKLLNVEPAGEVGILSWNLTELGSQAKNGNGVVEDRKSCGEKLKVPVSRRMVCVGAQEEAVTEGSPLLVGEESVVGVGSNFAKGDKGKLLKVFTNIANPEIYSFIERYIN